MAKSNYFSNTHTLQTCPTIDGVQFSVAYSIINANEQDVFFHDKRLTCMSMWKWP